MGLAQRLEGKRAVITGAGSGMGLAAARLFAAEGARVALLDRNTEAITEAAAGLDGAIAVTADVTDPAQMEAAFDTAAREFGGLDTVVPNAGVQLAGEDDRVDRLSFEVWQRTVDINLTGQFLACKYGAQRLLENGGGAIVCTASPTGQYGVATGYDAYSASKGGVYGLIRVMAADYGPHGIRVNGVIPGYMATPMTHWVDAEEEARLLKSVPLGRAGQADEIAPVMLFLASDEASFVTGAVWAADGGMTAV
jgi:NAD(P)-dependent dehydrogenase (short-subunit alcohol dehydrogenase family)